MRIPSLFSPRDTNARFITGCLPLFLLLHLLPLLAPGSAALASPLEIEAGMGAFIPVEDPYQDAIGPQVTLGVRMPLTRMFKCGFMLDGSYSRVDHEGEVRIPEVTNSSGSNLRLLQATIIVGTNSQGTPNITLGIGRFYAKRTDRTAYYIDGSSGIYHHDWSSGTVMQGELQFDIAHLGPSTIYASARFVRQIAAVESDAFSYLPCTVGVRFK